MDRGTQQPCLQDFFAPRNTFLKLTSINFKRYKEFSRTVNELPIPTSGGPECPHFFTAASLAYEDSFLHRMSIFMNLFQVTDM